MTARDLLVRELSRFVVPALASEGYGFFAPVPSFMSRRGDFERSVSIWLHSLATPDDCGFEVGFTIHSRHYAEWHRRLRGVPPEHAAVFNAAGHWLPGWPRQSGERFVLRPEGDNDLELATMLCATVDIGLPVLERMSDYRAAAGHLLATGGDAAKAADFLAMAGRGGAGTK